MATLKPEIVAREGRIFPTTGADGNLEPNDVDMVTLPSVEGEMGTLPMHVPLMTQLTAGEIIVCRGGQDFFLTVGHGCVEVTGERVSIPTDMAIKAENIDEAKAEEARQRAEARLAEKLDDAEVGSARAALAHSPTQLKVKLRQR